MKSYTVDIKSIRQNSVSENRMIRTDIEYSQKSKSK